MASKHREMDAVVSEIYTAMELKPHLQSTLFVLCGDHGMNDAGNHGGSSAGETSPALLFISPKFEALGVRPESPAEPFDELQYYQTIEQADITPTIAGLLGLPIPLNSLGVFVPEFLDMWESGPYSSYLLFPVLQRTDLDAGAEKLHILARNARQLLNTVKATFPSSAFDHQTIGSSCASGEDSGVEGAQCAWSQVQQLLSSDAITADVFKSAGPALLRFSRIAQTVMSSTASNYNVLRLGLGLLITGGAAMLVSPAVYYECTRSAYTGAFLAFMAIGYGAMMFASSYVEEEQQFWYWIGSGWIFFLHIKWASSGSQVHKHITWVPTWYASLATLGLAFCQRLLRRWNQTGQKFTAEPDIARGFFPAHPAILWVLVILTYADAGHHLLQSLPPITLARIGALFLTALALMFKLNFVAADSPELLAGTFVSKAVESWPGSVSLVWQARIIFAGFACCVILAAATRIRSGMARGEFLS